MPVVAVSGRAAFLDHPVRIGVVSDGGKILLIDSGIDDDSARRALGETGKVAAVLNTHAHADHCGGNAFLKEKTGCVVAAPGKEAPFVENPFLEPLCMFGFASPPKELRTKVFEARPCVVDVVVREGRNEIAGIPLEAIPLPGHSIGHTGYLVDGVLYCGDALFPERVIEKHKAFFHTDMERAIKSLGKLGEIGFEFALPSHGSPVQKEEALELARVNIESIERTGQDILELVSGKTATESVCSDFIRSYGLRNSVSSFFLNSVIVRAHLSRLRNLGLVELSADGSSVFWERTRI